MGRWRGLRRWRGLSRVLVLIRILGQDRGGFMLFDESLKIRTINHLAIKIPNNMYQAILQIIFGLYVN
jgi:hypothetical protein